MYLNVLKDVSNVILKLLNVAQVVSSVKFWNSFGGVIRPVEKEFSNRKRAPTSGAKIKIRKNWRISIFLFSQIKLSRQRRKQQHATSKWTN
jgi:hypothetical protein